MPLEIGTYISDLVVTNPVAADNLVDGDDHLRLIKSTLKTTFPTINAPLTATPTEFNYVAGVTSAIQTQLTTAQTTANAALPKAGGTMSGPIAMGASKITGMADGVVATDAATVGQATVALTAKANLTGNTFSADQAISTASGGNLTSINSTNPGVAAQSSGGWIAQMLSSTGIARTFASITSVITSATNTAEAGYISFKSTIAGTLTEALRIGAGLFMIGAIGGDKGAGTINATAYFINGIQSVFRTFRISGQAVPGVSTTTTYSHGLGVVPSTIDAYLVCVTAELGYAATEMVALKTGIDYNSNLGISLSANSLYIIYCQALNYPQIMNRGTYGAAPITPANWTLSFVATM